ncbi:MAG: ABC transporter substrate-binding protein [Gammaproteobacteria bacterium]|jgi:hypothetical protein
MKRLVLIMLLYWCLFSGVLVSTALAAEGVSKPVFRVAVVYRVGDTGNRILNGVNRAVKHYSNGNEKFQVEVEKYPYLDENAGIESIYKIFDDKSIHLVIGPSDSGVFVEVATRAEYEKKASIPIVSSLVTAQDGNKEGDWRFRTNVGVEARARAASDFLSHASYQAIAVLYRDNEFGKRASEAFKNQLIQSDENYLALPYADEVQLRDQVRKVLEKRPGAVGVFGRRHDLKIVRREFEALNSGWFEYHPLLFSINDTRALKLPDTYFVSLVGPNITPEQEEAAEVWDEVRGLAYDTTLLVLSVAEQIRSNPGDKNWAGSFRKRLFSRLLGPPQSDYRFKTGMEFSDGKNLAPPIVLRQTADAGEQIAIPGHPAAESDLSTGQDEANERREQPRISIDCAARLEILDQEQTILGELDVSMVDVSTRGARILIEAGGLDDIPDDWSLLRLDVTAGPLAGVSDEVKRIYQLATVSGIQLGVAWSGPTADVCERVREWLKPEDHDKHVT